MPPAPMTMMGRTCFGRGCRAVWTAARIRASRPSVAGRFGIGRSPSFFLSSPLAQRLGLVLTVPFASRRLQDSLDNRSCVAAHNGRANFVEVDTVLIKVGMLGQEGVLVVDKNFLCFHESLRRWHSSRRCGDWWRRRSPLA